MKVALIIFLTFSLVGIAVFGFLGMSHSGGENHQNGCIAAISDGIDCPQTAGVLNTVDFHVGAFKNFSNAVFGESFLITLLLLALFLFVIELGSLFGNFLVFPELNRILQRSHLYKSFSPPFKIQFTHWLALHENSPATS